MSTIISDAEFDALAGQPYMAQCLYFYLRRHMDYKTGVTGLSRGISYQSMSEALYIEPDRGFKTGSPHKMTIRRALERLEKHGLIAKKGNSEVLVFKLILAQQDKNAQNKVDTKPTPHPDTLKPSPMLAPQQEADTPKNAKADTPPLSVNTITKLPPPKNVPLFQSKPETEGEGVDKYLIYPKLSHEHLEQIKTIIKPLDPATKQDLLDELAGAIAYGQVKNPIGYMRVIAHKALGGIFIGELMYTVRQQRERKLENEYALSVAMLPPNEKPKIKPVTRKKPDGIGKLSDYLGLKK